MQPNYLLTGAMKAGTTSAIHHFNQHPNVFLEGELHFFDWKYGEGIEFYESQFNSTKKYVGEKTPSYCYLATAVDRICRHYPDIKLIMILREPVSRACSQYNMASVGVRASRKRGENRKMPPPLSESFDDCSIRRLPIRRVGYHVVERGFYIEHIEYILSKFDREQLYIGIAEEVLQGPLAEYNKMFEFLGAPPLDDTQFSFKSGIHTRTYEPAISKEGLQRAREIYEPYNERLYSFLGREIPSWEAKGV